MNLNCLVVGLGNPGPKYEHTRHNIGFTLIDLICKTLKVNLKEYSCQSVLGVSEWENVKFALVKPLTYMNLSGQAVIQLSRRYHVLPSKILVIADDLDLAIGQVRYREKGGAGGHNGHKSLIQSLKTQEYPRLKIGIGKPTYEPIDQFVLKKFSIEESLSLENALQKSKEIVHVWIKEGSIGVSKLLSLNLNTK